MNESRAYRWYIEHLDEPTNAYISQMLSDDTTLHVGKLCADGEEHTLWDCGFNRGYVKALTKATVPLNYRVYRQGGDEQIRLYQAPKKVLDLVKLQRHKK